MTDMVMDSRDYHALYSHERRLLEEWIVEHTGIPFKDDPYIVSVTIIGEGQIVIARHHNPVQWSLGDAGEVTIKEYETIYPSHRPPPLWHHCDLR